MEQMSFAEYAASIARDGSPPADLSAPLNALWHDARGDWAVAHGLVQEDGSERAAWVHAYLHRKEGDASNAGYWYAKAGRSQPTIEVTPRMEWEQIARELLGDRPSAR